MVNPEEVKSTEAQETAGVQEPTNDTALIACMLERDSWKDKYLRLQADFDNFNKRNIKERGQWAIAAQTALLNDILPIVDDFDRAFAELEKKEVSADVKNWFAGFAMIYKGLQKFLEKNEVVAIDPSLPFDPTYHEAISQVVAEGYESGQIVAILQKGYTFKGQVLRPARVSVAQ